MGKLRGHGAAPILVRSTLIFWGGIFGLSVTHWGRGVTPKLFDERLKVDHPITPVYQTFSIEKCLCCRCIFNPTIGTGNLATSLTTMLSHPSFAPAPKVVVHCNLWTETHLSTMHMHTLVPTFCMSNLKKGIRRVNHLQKEDALKKPRRAWRNMKKIAPCGTRKKGRNFQAPKVLKNVRSCTNPTRQRTETSPSSSASKHFSCLSSYFFP